MHGRLSLFFFCFVFPLSWINQSIQIYFLIYIYLCVCVYIYTLVCPGLYEITFTFVLTAVSFCLPVTLNLDPVNDQSALTRPHEECSFQSKIFI